MRAGPVRSQKQACLFEGFGALLDFRAASWLHQHTAAGIDDPRQLGRFGELPGLAKAGDRIVQLGQQAPKLVVIRGGWSVWVGHTGSLSS